MLVACAREKVQTLLRCLTRQRLNTRNVSTQHEQIVCSKLERRGLIKASGADTSAFLQGLITNDMDCLDTRCGVPCMYSMLLNTKGRVLYDLIVYHSPFIPDSIPDTYLLECDRDAAQELTNAINRFKIRKKVTLNIVTQEYDIWAIFPKELSERTESVKAEYKINAKHPVVADTYDPRLKSLSRRLILPHDIAVSDVLENVTEVDNDAYHERRFYFGIGEGVTDFPPGNSLPLDSNAVFMNGVSFNKGCYIGQELTARTQYTGVVRKRLMPVEFNSTDHKCDNDSKIENNKGKSCGKLRDSCGKYGLALLRIPDVINKGPLTVTDATGETKQELLTKLPWWWPKDNDPIIKQVLSQ